MKRAHFAASAIALAGLLSPASAAGIVFGPVRGQPGESVRLVTHSETPGGTITRTRDGKTASGTMAITRDRNLVWTFREPAADGSRRGMVKVVDLSSSTKLVINGKEDNANDTSPLKGKLFAMTKNPQGEWNFELDGAVPRTRVIAEIEELTVYLKRDWFPTKPVEVGDSWEFDPAWVKLIIEKDLAKAQTIGTMRLRQVRRAVGRQLAVIDVAIHSTGTDFKSDGTLTAASIELTGQVTVNLDTMLDETLELTGTVTSSSDKVSDVTKMKLPIKLTVTKSFVRDSLTP